jgi:DNA-binding NarL/FixJ family response regulator
VRGRPVATTSCSTADTTALLLWGRPSTAKCADSTDTRPNRLRRSSFGDRGRRPRRRQARTRLAELTDREREVAGAIGRGLSNAEISTELGMSVPTVKAHVSRLLTKLELNNRVEVALLIHDAELLD